MKYYIIAGEASGDLHGSNLMKELKKIDRGAEFRCWGGDLMQEQGGFLVKHYRELAYMGLVEVLGNIRAIRYNMKCCRQDILEYGPDVLILIDYPGFNLRMAKYAHKQNIIVFYYISPKVWAWKKSRVKSIKKYVNRLFTILPFETEFYRQHGYEIDYVGNPILDAIEEKGSSFKGRELFFRDNNLSDKPVIALLAGSRKQEIQRCLPEMLPAINQFKDYQFVIAAVPSIEKSFYKQYIQNYNVPLVFDQTYELLHYSVAAVVTSGTATLETALLNVPQVVCYKTSSMTYRVGKMLVDIEFFSLVNLIMGKEVVKELLQFNLAENIKSELGKLLFDNDYRTAMLENYKQLRYEIGKSGASKRLADLIYQYLT